MYAGLAPGVDINVCRPGVFMRGIFFVIFVTIACSLIMMKINQCYNFLSVGEVWSHAIYTIAWLSVALLVS